MKPADFALGALYLMLAALAKARPKVHGVLALAGFGVVVGFMAAIGVLAAAGLVVAISGAAR